MNLKNVDNILEVNNFILTSFSEVDLAVKKVLEIAKGNILIHIVAYMHNTVLIQNLKLKLEKKLPKAKIVLLKNNDKTNTKLIVYTIMRNVDPGTISDVILKEMHLDRNEKTKRLDAYRDKLLSRYFTDHLTNLPNVYQLRKDLDDNEEAGLIIINIDNFKTINNFYGFIVGDFVIEQIAKYLKAKLDNNVYKLSTDEFAITLEYSMGFYDLKEYLTSLYSELKDIVVEYQNIKIYIDITMASCSNTRKNDIFSKVSMALHYAKEMSIPFWIYEDRMRFENEYERNLKMSGLVRHAVENSNIIPYFQAIFDNRTSKIVKYECLARLVDDNNRILSPLLFIPVAKKIKVYNIVTKTIIDKSFAAFENSNFEFSVNLSIEDIMNSEIFKYILEKLRNSNASNRVTFELLESEAIQDFKRVERFIVEVKRYGAKIAIDDFGSGYSNFSYLTKMSVDYIKIDGSLIRDLDVDKNALIVVETIVAFAKKLGIKTIAEYVHSSTVMDKVKDLAIDYSQGFYVDKPKVNF